MQDLKATLLILGVLLVGAAAVFFWFDGDEVGNEGLGDASLAEEIDAGKSRRAGRSPEIGESDAAEEQNSSESTSRAPEGRDAFGFPYAALEGKVYDAQGEAIPDASIELFLDLSDSGGRSLRGAQMDLTVSDAEGAYRLDQVEVGERYLIRVRHEAFAEQRRGGLTFLAGQVAYQDFSLSAGFSIAGQVTADGGGPLPGARLLVYDFGSGSFDYHDQLLREAGCDDEGRYLLRGLDSGNKTVIAQADGFASEVRRGVETSRRRPHQSIEFKLERGLSLAGRIVNGDGDPIDGAQVYTQFVGQSGQADYVPAQMSGEDGRFSISGLRAGRYLLRASKQGFGRPAMTNVDAGDSEVVMKLSAVPVARGIVIDADTGEALKSCYLTVSRSPELLRLRRRDSQRLRSEDGRFEVPLDRINAGATTVWIFGLAPGYAGGSVEVALRPPDRPRKPLPASVDGLVLRLRRGASVVGRVVDAEGTAIPNAQVELRALAKAGDQVRARAMQDAQGYAVTALTAADGSFKATGLLAGEYAVTARHASYAMGRAAESVEVAETGQASIPDLRLGRGARVHGVVFDDEGRPEEGAKVTLVSREGRGTSLMLRTGLSGSYDFRNVPPGSYWLNVIERRGLSTYKPQDLVGGRTPILGLELSLREGEVREERL